MKNLLMPLRAIYRRAISRGEVAASPLTGLQLPASRGKRERIADPEEARTLLAVVPDQDRALWATALYGGLRLGELAALRWEDLDLAAGVIRVERSWDPGSGSMVPPKSRAGRRRVPIAAVLREPLLAHRLRQGRGGEGLVFGRSETLPFQSTSVVGRARRARTTAKLAPIGLHECRHTFASLMIAAGVNAKALSTYLGHASIATTLDLYGHLMPGHETEAASLLDSYLAATAS